MRSEIERLFDEKPQTYTDDHFRLFQQFKQALNQGSIRAAQPALHIVVTGRDAPPELIEAADLVTEMTEIKHPFTAGIRAQQGIEF